MTYVCLLLWCLQFSNICYVPGFALLITVIWSAYDHYYQAIVLGVPAPTLRPSGTKLSQTSELRTSVVNNLHEERRLICLCMPVGGASVNIFLKQTYWLTDLFTDEWVQRNTDCCTYGRRTRTSSRSHIRVSSSTTEAVSIAAYNDDNNNSTLCRWLAVNAAAAASQQTDGQTEWQTERVIIRLLLADNRQVLEVSFEGVHSTAGKGKRGFI